MAILKLKPRHACEGRSITAVLAECIDYSKAEYSKRTRACLKIHSRHMHAPLCGRFGFHSVNVAHYASLIRAKSPTNCDAHLTESNFQTRSSETTKNISHRRL